MASRKGRSRRPSGGSTRTERRRATSESAQTDTKANAQTVDQTEPAVEWSSEYHYVVRDLRQLLAVSALLFVAMLIVGYFV